MMGRKDCEISAMELRVAEGGKKHKTNLVVRRRVIPGMSNPRSSDINTCTRFGKAQPKTAQGQP
jgi:hypothetical protein